MVIQLNDCFSLPLKTGCIIIGIIYGVENLVAIIGLSWKAVDARQEFSKKTQARVMKSSLVILAILNSTMLLTDLCLILGAILERGYLLYAWVIIYTVLMIMTTLAYVVLAIICILLTSCKTALAITVIATGWISFSIYIFCFLVVYSYFKTLSVWTNDPSQARPGMPSDPSDLGQSTIIGTTDR